MLQAAGEQRLRRRLSAMKLRGHGMRQPLDRGRRLGDVADVVLGAETYETLHHMVPGVVPCTKSLSAHTT